MNHLQTSKQTPASLPEICAPRPELLRTFERAAKNKYIYVQAPAGYGKTISTLLWLKKTDCKTIWISLDTYDNTPLLFYKLFCMSLLNVIPYDQEVSNLLKSPAFNATPIECTIDLMSQLLYEGQKYALILDDFHFIQNEEIKKSLPYILKRLPIVFTAVILSRKNLPEAEISLYGQENISQIGIHELSFSDDEIRKHFASYGRFITKDESMGIKEYTEGWVIAINTMAMSGIIDVSHESQKLSINSFFENIWARLDDPMRNFLVKTSVPDRFSLELCEYLTEADHCKETLDVLVSDNAHISLMGSQFRYHNLFLDFLRDKLSQSNLDKATLNKKVADYYLNTGDFLAAKNYAMKSGDMLTISQTIRSFYSIKTFSLDEYVDFHKLYNLHNIPDVICDKAPLLYLARIFFAYLNGDVDVLKHLFDKLFPLLTLIAEKYPESLENATSILLMDCRIKLSELDKYIAKIPTVQHTHTSLQSPTFTFQLPFLHRCARDFYEILDPHAMNNVSTFSENIIKENLEIMFKGAESGLLMEKNELHEALDLALYLKSTINDSMSPEFVYAIYVLIAELYLLQNKQAKYETTMKEVKGYISISSSQYLLKNLSAYESRRALLNGEKAAADHWLKCYYINDHSFNEFYKIYRNYTTVRAYIVLNQMDKAYNALHQLKALSEKYSRLLDIAEADVLLSIIDWVTGKKKEAQNRLRQVLESLQPYGFIRVIANEGNAVLPILSSITKKLEKEPGQPDDLHKYVKKVYIVAYEQSKYFKGLTHSTDFVKVSLSPKQKYVLELLAKGYNNAEIVELTGLSLNTIRTHTKLIYKKLEVNNALDAILQAKQLEIIK
ncbi:MAG: hypothetical protein CVU84_06790 [Firmicutes bacterium HGW-Firmicutes-1]|jgi:LuxR family maltose regulon positive regulatory protein|nr:MAG: hypothetical protein CVU84_06790 [Firmicutes bacterium HGW-Firmicutes-1]